MSQRELARRSGVPQPQVCRIEAGKTAWWTTYERLTRAMGGELLFTVKRTRPREEIVAGLLAERLALEERARARRFSRRRRG